jgi:hypothetical protein
VFVPSKSPLKGQPEILGISFLGELHVVYTDRRACISSCGECDVDRIGSVSFQFPFFEPVLNCKYVGL